MVRHSGDKTGSVVDAQFVVDCLRLVSDGRGGNAQNSGCFLVALSAGQQLGDVLLARRQQIEFQKGTQDQLLQYQPVGTGHTFTMRDQAPVDQQMFTGLIAVFGQPARNPVAILL